MPIFIVIVWGKKWGADSGFTIKSFVNVFLGMISEKSSRIGENESRNFFWGWLFSRKMCVR